MADLILPRPVTVSYNLLNYFMTAPAVTGIPLPAATATDIGPGEQSWVDDTGAAITEFAVDISTPPTGTQYAYQLIVDGQVQEEELVTTVSNVVLSLTSATAAAIPASARVVFTIFEVVTA